MQSRKLLSHIAKFKKLKIMVVGDIMLDGFIWGNVSRISPEAPVPVVWVNSESFMPGGASNVASNLHALGCKVYLCGVMGSDINGKILKSELLKRKIDIEGVIIDKSRATTLKTRVIAHSQQVVRIDREEVAHIEDNVLSQIITFIKEKISDIDAIIIEDYGKGMVVPRLLKEVVGLGKRHKKIIAVDPKEEHFDYYKGVTVITPNNAEASKACGVKIQDEAALRKVGNKLLDMFESEAVLVTLGENGMCLLRRRKKPIHIPTVAQEVYDVCGAGDTVISAFTAALSSGATMEEAAYISNYAAGIAVGKVGVTVVSCEEIEEKIQKISKSRRK